MNIKIKLKSDTITYSGEGISGIIDSDVCYDEYGIPFIPSKRLKGVLRENALELLENGYNIKNEDLDYLFGKKGDSNSGNIRISNAYLKDYEILKKEIKFKNDKIFYNKESIISYFTYLRNQTAINEDGVAEKHSLRTSRVLKKGLEFIFSINFDPKFQQFMLDVFKVTRSIGLKRNRGFGEVEISPAEKEIEKNKNYESNFATFSDDTLCEIEIVGLAEENLILNNNFIKKDESENFIPGSFLLGYLANKYIKINSNNSDFREIFLKNNVRFNNLYLFEEGKEFIPCPNSIQKVKDSEEIVDLTQNKKIEKILKGKFSELVSIEGNKIFKKEIDKEINYHHQRPIDRSIGKAGNNVGKFYQYESLKEDYRFKGSIIGKYKYLKEILRLFNAEKIMYLGRSKSAEYGKFYVETVEIGPLAEKNYEIKAGSDFVITFKSDLIIRDQKTGFITKDLNVFLKLFADILGIDQSSLEIQKSFIKTKFLGGFLSVWRLPKIQIECIAAGSEIVVKTTKDISISQNKIRFGFGERINEGFGEILINYHGFKDLVVAEDKNQENRFEDKELNNSETFIKLNEYLIWEKIKDKIKLFAIKKDHKKISVSKSFLYRLNNIFMISNNSEEIKTKLNNIGDKRKDLVLKLKEILYLDKTFKINLEKFEDSLRNSPEFKDVLNNNFIDLNEQTIFKIYKLYVENFLTVSIYNKRKGEVKWKQIKYVM